MHEKHSKKQVECEPYEDQTMGNMGLRKPLEVFQQRGYIATHVESVLQVVFKKESLVGTTWVVGGDGREFCKEAINQILLVLGGHQVGHVVVGHHGWLSTPALSHLVVKRKAKGGFLLTASHKTDKYFGLKFTTSNGGYLPVHIMDEMYEVSKTITSYPSIGELVCPLEHVWQYMFKVEGSPFIVEVCDPTREYVQLMKSIFDFPRLKKYFHGDELIPREFTILVDCMNGGPYAVEIFERELGAKEGSVIRNVPRTDFGGIKPDSSPRATRFLKNAMVSGPWDLGAALDADGDRVVLLGRKGEEIFLGTMFALIARHLHCIPYFQRNGIKGFSRSLSTASDVDKIYEENEEMKVVEVPSGWRYVSNLLAMGSVSIGAIESYGIGALPLLERDGIWTILAFVSVLRHMFMSVKDAQIYHWKEYGRFFFARADYYNFNEDAAQMMFEYLESCVKDPKFFGSAVGDPPLQYIVKSGENFVYNDPVDQTSSEKAGTKICFEDGSRIVFRMSLSKKDTLKMYLETCCRDPSDFEKEPLGILQPLIDVAVSLSRLGELTGRKVPDKVLM